MAVQIVTPTWKTATISYEKGLFQGCPLSVILFLMVFQMCIDQLQTHKHLGYQMNSKVTNNQRAYADDLTLIAKDRTSANIMLKTLEQFLKWTVTMKAKPTKCRALSLEKIPGTSTMTPTDPELSIDGQLIPFIHQDPMKFLGQLIYKDLSDNEVRAKTKDKLENMLKQVNADLVHNTGKLWIYEHMVVAKVSWEFTVYCFPISFAKQLESLANAYLKKWAGLSRSTNTSVLYRQRHHGGLNITSLSTKLKCTQLIKYHQLKYAADPTTNFIYGHIANRLMKKKQWNGVRELEEKERHLALNVLCRGNSGRAGLGLIKLQKPVSKMSKTEHRQELTRLTKQSEEHQALVYVYNMAQQGRPLAWDAVMFLDISWRSLVYSFSDKLLSFYLNSMADTLPSPSNLMKWKATSLGSCPLCDYNHCTLFHILSNCRFSLMTGRYNWRHDMVLRRIVEHLGPTVVSKASKSKGTRFKSATGNEYYVPPLRTNNEKRRQPAEDWQMVWDEEFHQYTFPPQIVSTSARPDLVFWSEATRKCVIAELTVCWEENFQQAHERKAGKKEYMEIVSSGQQNGWDITLLPIEVGTRGVISNSLLHFLRFMGLSRKKALKAADIVGRTSLQASYTIWLSRKQKEFSKWTLVERPESSVSTPTVNSQCPAKTPAQLRVETRADRTKVAPLQKPPQARQPGAGWNPRGLTNMGNTCFLNAVAQCLLANEPLTSSARNGIEKALSSIKTCSTNVTRPTELARILQRLSPNIMSGQQQDAAEALEILLRPGDGGDQPSELTERNSGRMADYISCKACNSRTERERPLNPPIIPVAISAGSLEACLKTTFAPQPLPGRQCGVCGNSSRSTLTTTLLETPECIVLHLLRFQQGLVVEKDTTALKLTPTVQLHGHAFNITGTINHQGMLDRGHYTAHVRHQHQWFHCNDTQVEKVTAAAALHHSAKSAYLIFLRRARR